MHARIPLYEKRGKSDGRRNERGELFGTKRMTNSFLQNKILFNVYYPKLGFQTKGGIVWSTRFTPEVITCFFFIYMLQSSLRQVFACIILEKVSRCQHNISVEVLCKIWWLTHFCWNTLYIRRSTRDDFVSVTPYWIIDLI